MRTIRTYAPGRTELAGNHTDHQGGRVVAGAVSCGIEMALSANGLGRARVESAGFPPFEIDLACDDPREDERFTTRALVRGVVAGMRRHGVPVEGFDLAAHSSIPAGSGLSSSAAFEIALGRGLDGLFGGQGCPVAPLEIARIGQAAERDYFGKPCGLMDQLACALGGIVSIDFADAGAPAIEGIDFDFRAHGYELHLVDTHCDHSRYTDEYSRVARDMTAVAQFMGATRLSEVPEGAFMERFEDVRAHLDDLAALRGLHYYREMALVDARIRALREGDMPAFLRATRLSGASSAQYLQNVSCMGRPNQPAMVALALCDALLGIEGACRIHGGGFGGTVQAFVPFDAADAFRRSIDAHLGEGSCRPYSIGAECANGDRAN